MLPIHGMGVDQVQARIAFGVGDEIRPGANADNAISVFQHEVADRFPQAQAEAVAFPAPAPPGKTTTARYFSLTTAISKALA